MAEGKPTRHGRLREALISTAMAVAAVGIYFTVDYFVDLPPTALEFRAERIEAVIDGDTGERVTFICDMTFYAGHARRRSYELAFPTSYDAEAGAPMDVTVEVDGRPVEPRMGDEGFTYRLEVEPGQEVRSLKRYTMAAPERRAMYITRTANLWPKPVSRSVFVLPTGASSNYHDDATTEAVFVDFAPDEDWTIRWD
jgi:hypothetical protein